ncbi:MAG: molybdate ABC transporter substrate-binding protein, partial [Planctomycetota bacterium]
GHGRPDRRILYARGRLTVWTPGSPIETLNDLQHPQFERIALANPDHAPYGLAAKEALITEDLWEKLQPRIVFGNNILDTLRIARSGNADAAVIALSLALAETRGSWIILDEHLHQPIDQAVMVSSHSRHPEAAWKFIETMNSPAGRAIMRRYGFVLPGEALDVSQMPDQGNE